LTLYGDRDSSIGIVGKSLEVDLVELWRD